MHPNRTLKAFVVWIAILSACTGEIKGPKILAPVDATPSPTPHPIVQPPDASVPEPIVICPTATPHAVSGLLRTSNIEYQQMMSDLLQLNLNKSQFNRWTPNAQVYGFDTMTQTRIDSLGLQEQLRTVEELSLSWIRSRQYVSSCPALPVEPTAMCSLKNSYNSEADFSSVQGQNCWSYFNSAGAPLVYDAVNARWRNEPDVGLFIWAAGGHPGAALDSVRRWTAPVDGFIELSGVISDVAGTSGDGVTISINKGATELRRTVIENRGDDSYQLALSVKRGDVVSFSINKTGGPEYDSTAFSAAIAFTPAPQTNGFTWENCAKPALIKWASRAFRRPLRVDEIENYRQQFQLSLTAATTADLGSPFSEAFTTVVQSALLSPNVMFKAELVPGGLDDAEKQYAVASKLGLFFRGSLPDEELWSKAQSNSLSNEAAVRTEASRLLSANLDRFTSNFGGQWLDFRDAASTTDPLLLAMQSEPSLVFKEVLETNSPPEKLLSPGFTFVSAPLAAHYGLTSYVTGLGGIQRIPTMARGGLLSQASFLTKTAMGSEFRRPIHRGLWTLTRLMCQELPRLDAATLEEIGASIAGIDATLPLPKKMELHRKTTMRCIGCHGKIDPIGLALENYDERGLWRTRYASGAPIDNDFAFDGVSVRNPIELNSMLENSESYRTCVATKLLTFALNRGPLEAELCAMKTLAKPANGTVPSLQSLAIDTMLQSFTLTGVGP
jgi:hypothetical protein